MYSLCIAVEVHEAFNSTKPLNVVTEAQEWAPLPCCRATEYFLLLSTIEMYVGFRIKCLILLSDFIQI